MKLYLIWMNASGSILIDPACTLRIFVINELPGSRARYRFCLIFCCGKGYTDMERNYCRRWTSTNVYSKPGSGLHQPRFHRNPKRKDRIESQILTHYPARRDIAKNKLQWRCPNHETSSLPPRPMVWLRIWWNNSFEARNSEYIDKKIGRIGTFNYFSL